MLYKSLLNIIARLCLGSKAFWCINVTTCFTISIWTWLHSQHWWEGKGWPNSLLHHNLTLSESTVRAICCLFAITTTYRRYYNTVKTNPPTRSRANRSGSDGKLGVGSACAFNRYAHHRQKWNNPPWHIPRSLHCLSGVAPLLPPELMAMHCITPMRLQRKSKLSISRSFQIMSQENLSALPSLYSVDV